MPYVVRYCTLNRAMVNFNHNGWGAAILLPAIWIGFHLIFFTEGTNWTTGNPGAAARGKCQQEQQHQREPQRQQRRQLAE